VFFLFILLFLGGWEILVGGGDGGGWFDFVCVYFWVGMVKMAHAMIYISIYKCVTKSTEKSENIKRTHTYIYIYTNKHPHGQNKPAWRAPRQSPPAPSGAGATRVKTRRGRSPAGSAKSTGRRPVFFFWC
jgi:hypothetical protein